MVTGGDGCKVKLWNLRTGKMIKCMSNARKEIYQVLISENGKTVVTRNKDTQINFWDHKVGTFIGFMYTNDERESQ